MQKFKDISFIFFCVIISIFLLYFIFIRWLKFDINNFKDYIFISLTIISSFGIIAITLIIFCIGYINNQNKLFTEIIQEYSTKDINYAIIDITDFVKKNDCEIFKDDLNNFGDQAIIDKKIKLVKKYIELKKNKKTLKLWKDLDFKRRLLNNYFDKIYLLCKNNLINKKLLQEFWSIISLKYLSQYLITLIYIALPIINNGDQEDSMKPAYLVDFYNNYFVDKNHIKKFFPKLDKINIKDFKIKLDDLRNIYNCCKCKKEEKNKKSKNK